MPTLYLVFVITLYLFRSMIDLYLDVKDNKMSLPFEKKSHLLTAFVTYVDPMVTCHVGEQNTNPVLLLKISNMLRNEFTRLVKGQEKIKNSSSISNFLCCYVLFEYLFAGVKALQDAVEELLEHQDLCERLDCSDAFVYTGLLLKHHSETEYENFAVCKNILERCSRTYGNNSLLNSLLMTVTQNGLDSLHIRRYYENIIEHNDDVVPWLHALKYELNRLKFVSPIPSAEQVLLLSFFPT